MADKLEKDGYEVEQESMTEVPASRHSFDVLAIKDGQTIDCEITISDDNIRDNIINGFMDQRIDSVVIIAEKDKLDKLKKKTRREQDTWGKDGRLQYQPISDYFI